MDLTGKKLAFISVFDKTGVDQLAKRLVEDFGYVILSTGGTQKFLTEKGIPAIESSDITGFNELLGGRVKSLHPAIFGAILAERDKSPSDDYLMPDFFIDTVVVNLYPFEQERDNPQFASSKHQDPYHLLHFIDIGGSALIRAAAKNYPDVNVLCDPAAYDAFLEALKAGNGKTDLNFRKQLAIKAFQRSVSYESAIYQEMAKDVTDDNGLPDYVLPLMKIQDLRYGENPHQLAALYGLGKRQVDFDCLQGKELSFNNILDMQAGWNIVTEFSEQPACVIIKHNNPCGVALSSKSLFDAYKMAFDVDPLSAFGGVVAFNQTVDEKTAEQMKEVFLEVIIAPDFAPGALDVLKAKKNLRLVKRPLPDKTRLTGFELKQVTEDLYLVQTNAPDKEIRIDALAEQEILSVVTETKPTPEQLRDLVFAWKVVKHVKSNAIVLAHEGRTVGIGGGQTSRIGALENALKIACDQSTNAVMASDGFLPQEDNIHAAVQARLSAIIQPGGSIKDPDVIALANQNNIAMVMTGVREFKH